MSLKSDDCCAVCGHTLDPLGSAYLLMAQPAANRIAILRWNRTLAAREEARAACTPEHALEIVAHWMVSGRLDLRFTQAAPQPELSKSGGQTAAQAAHPVGTYKPIGELVINRDSVRKLVASDPEALASVLDSLLEAVLRDRNSRSTKMPALTTAATRHASIA